MQENLKKEDITKEIKEFVPGTNYTWDIDSKFILSGIEFGYLYNALQLKKTEVLRDLEMINIFESKLRDAVSTGVAKEAKKVSNEDRKVVEDILDNPIKGPEES